MDVMTEFDRSSSNPSSNSCPTPSLGDPQGTDYRDYVSSILEYIAACHRQADLDPGAKQHLTKIASDLLEMIERLEEVSPLPQAAGIARRFTPQRQQ